MDWAVASVLTKFTNASYLGISLTRLNGKIVRMSYLPYIKSTVPRYLPISNELFSNPLSKIVVILYNINIYVRKISFKIPT